MEVVGFLRFTCLIDTKYKRLDEASPLPSPKERELDLVSLEMN